VLIEVDGRSMVCRLGEMGVAPAGSPHGFVVLGALALLEVFGEQAAGTVFLLADDEEIEVHRPGVPWDRTGRPIWPPLRRACWLHAGRSSTRASVLSPEQSRA
jgi:hypothetical protein